MPAAGQGSITHIEAVMTQWAGYWLHAQIVSRDIQKGQKGFPTLICLFLRGWDGGAMEIKQINSFKIAKICHHYQKAFFWLQMTYSGTSLEPKYFGVQMCVKHLDVQMMSMQTPC